MSVRLLQSPALRRVLGLALVLVVALIFGRTFQRAPVDVVVRYRLPADTTNLVVSYRDPAGGFLRRSQFRYPPGSAPREQAHEVRLPRGEDRAELELERTAAGGRAAEVRLERRILVTGEGDSPLVDLGAPD
jgi:hypothetical protein